MFSFWVKIYNVSIVYYIPSPTEAFKRSAHLPDLGRRFLPRVYKRPSIYVSYLLILVPTTASMFLHRVWPLNWSPVAVELLNSGMMLFFHLHCFHLIMRTGWIHQFVSIHRVVSPSFRCVKFCFLFWCLWSVDVLSSSSVVQFHLLFISLSDTILNTHIFLTGLCLTLSASSPSIGRRSC